MRRISQITGWTLIWSGLFIFGYLGWQLYGTDVVNAGVQAEATEDVEALLAAAKADTPIPTLIDPVELDPETPPAQAPASPTTTEPIQHFQQANPELGTAFAFLRIPKIGVDEAVFEGVDVATLKMGPGHMPGTPLPGQPGNAVLSGHRTTYGRPFFDLDLLEVGDTIEVESEVGVHRYEVREILVVTPYDFWVTYDRSGGWLTLTTCNPKFSARERLIVWAEMVSGPNYEVAQLHTAAIDEQGT